MNCGDCVHYIYDNSVGLGECALMIEDPDTCGEFYNREDARDAAELRFAPEGKD